jgi:hypothetical protein
MTESTPRVELDWSLWCHRHLSPYEAQWPKGAAVAMTRLFNAAVRMPVIADAAGHDARNLTRALRRFAPLCCFISREALEAIYAETVPAPPEEHDD